MAGIFVFEAHTIFPRRNVKMWENKRKKEKKLLLYPDQHILFFQVIPSPMPHPSFHLVLPTKQNLPGGGKHKQNCWATEVKPVQKCHKSSF